MYKYSVRLEADDNDTLVVTCPDLPGVVTFGESRDDALAHAVDAIEERHAALMDGGRDIPAPASAIFLRPQVLQMPGLGSPLSPH